MAKGIVDAGTLQDLVWLNVPSQAFVLHPNNNASGHAAQQLPRPGTDLQLKVELPNLTSVS